MIFMNYLKQKLNLTPMIEEYNDINALPYLIKLLLKEKYNIPVLIDPTNVYDETISVEQGEFSYFYTIEDFNIYFDFEWKYND